MDSKKVETILIQHVPASAVNYCIRLWTEFPFDFVLRRNRLSKVGDFTCRAGKTPQITVNHNLHPYLFLMTYIHEVAHLHVHQNLGFRVEAHGTEWKAAFQNLMAPVSTEETFPYPLLDGIIKHMASPKASSFSDAGLTQLFRDQDEREKSTLLLSQIPEGSIFRLHGRWFKKGKLKRTRVLCNEVKSRRQYLIPADAPVSNTQLALL
jgi:SprT protein